MSKTPLPRSKYSKWGNALFSAMVGSTNVCADLPEWVMADEGEGGAEGQRMTNENEERA